MYIILLQEISLNDIMDKSIFVNDQRSNVLKAIRRIRRDFVPVYTPPQLTYSNDLLATLNDFIDPISKIPHKSVYLANFILFCIKYLNSA